MTLVPTPALDQLDLSEIQLRSLTTAAEHMSKAGSPIPDSVRQDTAGTVHLTWLVYGARITLTLAKSGRIGSTVSIQSGRHAVMGSLVAFQVQLQEFFAI